MRIEELGWSEQAAVQYRRLLACPQGLVLLVGPTGSGKSTTLYAGLEVLAADPTRKVITIEDPVELTVDRVQQVQVQPDLGFHFSQAMRAFVREDPDVIMVGEIRDSETALEAIRASQTGHLVLSTLHCNDSTDAIQRLVDLGLHPNSIASEMLAVLAQRLARRICSDCRVAAVVPSSVGAEVFPAGSPTGLKTFEGKGCPSCRGTGTRGRVAVTESLNLGPAMRRAITARAPLHELRAVARQAGLRSLRERALELVDEGVISLDELPNLLSLEQLSPEVG